MPALDSKLRSQLDDVCQKARDLSVAYALSALQKRAVEAAEPLSHFDPKDKELRNRLRARGRQVGDVRNADGTQSIDQLAQELAYEFWHRMLFARFLAENHLLMHPDGVAVSLEECEELAPNADPPAVNGFVLAARYASTMLPQIFRTDDVLLEIEFAPEQRLALEKLLASLPRQTFEADDSLGWVYQFWQTAEKKRVNDSGDKIDGRTLPAVTQLFTEHYMVEFLLHNTIGAWWCAKEGIQGPPGGAGIPAGQSPVEMPYLRWRDDGTPAAGKFEGWHKSLIEFTMLDPCCGSGHFLVAAFNMLVPLRMRDEGLTAVRSCEAVMRDNIFGLELDPRCTQIAAFALALAAWRYPDTGGFRPLPQMNIACSGQGVTGKKDEWLALANGDEKLRNGMDRLYDLFQQAPHLGSLIDPRNEKGNMYEAGYAELQPLMNKALAKKTGDADMTAVGVAAKGIARSAELLAYQYTLICTNVPYLGRSKQAGKAKEDEPDGLKDYIDNHYPLGKSDLSTAFVLRITGLCKPQGTMALVTPQNWLLLTSYTTIRERLLKTLRWQSVVSLGEEAWWSFGIRGPRTVLLCIDNVAAAADHAFFCMDLSTPSGQPIVSLEEKELRLANRERATGITLSQKDQLRNPDFRVVLTKLGSQALLSAIAVTNQGPKTGDDPRMRLSFWELCSRGTRWRFIQGSSSGKSLFDGCSDVVDWTNNGALMARLQGVELIGKKGVAVGIMRSLPVSLFLGEVYDSAVSPIVPLRDEDIPAVLAFCQSDDYKQAIRFIDQKVAVTNATLLKVPFDLTHWQAVATEKYPNGLPEPHSDDPTQWLFKGDVSTSTDPLQVAVARLLGYRWIKQPSDADAIDKLADSDGILCLPGVRGEAAASERFLEVLHAAYGKDWSESVLHKLLTDAGCRVGTTLEDWLRNQFFEQHCKRFQNRPFIWHIWDGRKDGFSALVNYHKFDHKALENLTYSYLGDWIKAQSKSDKAGADSRLGASQDLQAKLKLILAGEPPYDIFVRWKPIYEQAIGWHPDLNDGVRMNIRPFMEAGILRKNPNIKWTKDRGNEPNRGKEEYPWFWSGKEFTGERVNDVHLTNPEKQAARSRMKGAK